VPLCDRCGNSSRGRFLAVVVCDKALAVAKQGATKPPQPAVAAERRM